MSIKSRMMHIIMRYRHLFMKGQLRAEGVDFNTSVEYLREDCDKTAARLKSMPQGVEYIQAEFEPLYAEWVLPKDAPNDKVILYFHGGGFIMGNAKSHRGIVGNFVKYMGVKALVFDYRLAPENPAPAAIHDSAQLYQWLLLQGYSTKNIVFAGDSAGGGIELGTLLNLKDEGLPLPAGAVAFSPCTDMTLSGESHKTRRRADPCTPKGMNEVCAAYYSGEGDRKNPYASPIYGDLSGLPPIMIQVGNDETLRDDSVLFAQHARKAGSEVTLHVWKNMFHCFVLLAPMFKEAEQAMDEVREFVRKLL